MMESLRDGYANLITSCGHLLILLLAAQVNLPWVWVAALSLISVISFAAWASALRRRRAIGDTPTSSIDSAAQGYVELYARASAAPEFRVQSKAGSLPCIWFRCVTYRKGRDNEWEEVDRSVSDSIFELADASGKCMVDPDHAEVITSHHRTWHDGQYKHVEEQLFASDQLYVLGEFCTLGGANSALDLDADVGALLAEWKKNQPDLLRRFDLDGNGQIDLKEWALARNAARREVEQQHRELRLKTGVHVIRRPQSGQLFLLSNLSPHQLRQRYLLWCWFHLATFFGGVGGATWVALYHMLGR